jgi:hypothetical protein
LSTSINYFVRGKAAGQSHRGKGRMGLVNEATAQVQGMKGLQKPVSLSPHQFQ